MVRTAKKTFRVPSNVYFYQKVRSTYIEEDMGIENKEVCELLMNEID